MSLGLVDALQVVFETARSNTDAVRALVPYFNLDESGCDANRFITEKAVGHFRSNNKPDGVYRLGHGLELVLGRRSVIQEEVPF